MLDRMRVARRLSTVLLAVMLTQALMGLAKDLAGASGMLNGTGPSEVPGGMWHYGFLFAPALTVGGGTGEVQRNIVAERVLGLPHDVDVEQGQTWAESRRAG